MATLTQPQWERLTFTASAAPAQPDSDKFVWLWPDMPTDDERRDKRIRELEKTLVQQQIGIPISPTFSTVRGGEVRFNDEIDRLRDELDKATRTPDRFTEILQKGELVTGGSSGATGRITSVGRAVRFEGRLYAAGPEGQPMVLNERTGDWIPAPARPRREEEILYNAINPPPPPPRKIVRRDEVRMISSPESVISSDVAESFKSLMEPIVEATRQAAKGFRSLGEAFNQQAMLSDLLASMRVTKPERIDPRFYWSPPVEIPYRQESFDGQTATEQQLRERSRQAFARPPKRLGRGRSIRRWSTRRSQAR